MNYLLLTGNEMAEYAAEIESKKSAFSAFFEALPSKALNLGIRVVIAAIVLVIGIWIIKLVRKLLSKALSKGKADQTISQFIDSLVKVVLYILLAFVIASNFGMDAAGILTLLGSVSVAIGLAVQGTLSNFAGGVMLLLLRPFKVGDYIKACGYEGSVQEMTIFYTKLVTPDNQAIILPNGPLANGSMVNVSKEPTRRIDVKVGISYNADIKKAKKVLLDMLTADEAVLETPGKEPDVFVAELADSSVVLNIRWWVNSADYWSSMARLTEGAKTTLDKNEIEIPFPQLDVHKK